MAWVPMEVFPSSKLEAQPWEWRVYDPASRTDTLFLRVPGFPSLIRWTPDFSSVAFVVRNQIMRAPWSLDARPEVFATTPIDSAVCDFWVDPHGELHVLTQVEIREPAPPGYGINVASRWDRDRRGVWSVAVVDTGGDSYGGCFSSARLEDGAPSSSSVRLSAILDSMLIFNQLDSIPERGDRGVWVPSTADSSVGMEIWTGFGDTYHAMEPFVWVDRTRGHREVVYPEGVVGFGQLAFAERGGFMLIASEYEGEYPAVVEMRTGRVLLRVVKASARAVWVQAPH